MKNEPFKITVENNWEYELVPEDLAAADIVEVEGGYHLLLNDTGYHIEVMDHDTRNRTMRLRVNDIDFEVHISDHYERLIEQLGLDTVPTLLEKELKAPMPGLIVDIKVKPKDTVLAGDTLLVLEAMKMENLVKSPQDGVIASVGIKKGEAVEKNQVLLVFEEG